MRKRKDEPKFPTITTHRNVCGVPGEIISIPCDTLANFVALHKLALYVEEDDVPEDDCNRWTAMFRDTILEGDCSQSYCGGRGNTPELAVAALAERMSAKNIIVNDDDKKLRRVIFVPRLLVGEGD